MTLLEQFAAEHPELCDPAATAFPEFNRRYCEWLRDWQLAREADDDPTPEPEPEP